MFSCMMETSLDFFKKKKSLKLLNEDVICDYFCGFGAQIEKLIVYLVAGCP